MNKLIYVFILSLSLTACGGEEKPVKDTQTQQPHHLKARPGSTMDIMNQGLEIQQKSNKTLEKLKQPPKIPMNQMSR